ncbi:MAG TPA: phage major capsid protein, partial [Urbifossiella sp.]|nr:phage major capsid protein [Urbifossiella sp.]
ENELDEQYTPDADTENSGGIAGAAHYWFNKNVYNALRKLKGDDQYHLDVQTMIRDKQIQGYKFKRIVDLPSAPAVSTRFGMFGNLGYVYMAHRNGIRTDMLKEGIVGGVNLGTTGQYAMRWIEFVDFALVDDEALSFLKTAAA